MAAGDELLAWKKAAENAPPIPLTECPLCSWTLDKNKEGKLHCKFCGWTS